MRAKSSKHAIKITKPSKLSSPSLTLCYMVIGKFMIHPREGALEYIEHIVIPTNFL